MKITVGGGITSRNFADGTPATANRFLFPTDVARTDDGGFVFAADSGAIYGVDANGTINRLAGHATRFAKDQPYPGAGSGPLNGVGLSATPTT